MPVLNALKLIAPVTTSAPPTPGTITPYNATSGALTPTLPALSGLNVGAQFGVQKWDLDTSLNTVVVTAAGTDTFDTGLSTLTLRVSGESRVLQVAMVGTAKVWKVIGGHNPIGGLDLRYLAPDVIAPAATGVAATDTANLLAAIAATPANGWLHVRRGRYLLNAPLVLANPIRLTGAGVFTVGDGSVLPDNPFQAPYLNGTVFVQTAAATDAIQVSGTSNRVDLADFGIVFDSSIAFVNTGHGINATPPLISGQSYHTSGLITSIWKNITVFGHDGNHYARVIVNSMHNTMEHIRCHGGGILKLVSDHPTTNFGNHVETHPFGSFFSGGTADAYHFEGPSSGSAVLNLVTFTRPQVNVSSLQNNGKYPNTPVPPTASQYAWRELGNVRDIQVNAPDLENDLAGVTCPIAFGAKTYVNAGGGYMLPVPAYVERKRNTPSTQPTLTLLAGGGSSTVTHVAGTNDDDSGILNFQVPAGAGLPGSDLFTVTFANPKQVAPKFVHLWIHFATSNTTELFVASAYSATGFTVRGFPAPPNSGSWQIAYKVEP